MLQKVIGEPRFMVRCLGGLSLVDVSSGTDMTPAKRKPRALLGYLCIEQKPVGRERLATLLWGDRGDEQARASLRQTIYELRSPLGGDRLLRTEGDSVAIGERVSTDIQAITTAAESGDLEQLRRALSQWRGEILENLSSIDAAFDAWLETARLRVREALFRSALDAAKAGMASGAIEQSRQIVNLLQERDNTDEMVLRLGLTLDHLAGDSTTLHRRYERFKSLLRSELDATPSTETQRLFQQLGSEASAPVVRTAPGANGKDAPDDGNDHSISAARFPERSAAVPSAQKATAGFLVHRGSAILATVVASAILVLAAFAWLIPTALHRTAPSRPEPLLAVLPFQNLSTDPDSRYFSDGITAELVDALLRITQIRVASASSSFRLRDVSAPNAAKALAATHLLSGSVRRNENRINVIAQLTDARSNQVVWSGTYDRTMTEIPALQHDIAVEIANALDMRLSPASLSEAQKVSPEAYEHYLKGRDLIFQRNQQAALAELSASVRLAPDFAKAWATLAATRFSIACESVSPSGDYDTSTVKAARAAAQRALALDSNSGEALAVLASLTPSNRLLQADRLYQRALQFEPNNAELLNLYAAFLIDVGRWREAVADLTRAYELDRVISSVASNLVLTLLQTGAFDKANEIIGLSRDSKLPNEFLRLHAEYFLYRQDWPGLAKFLSALPPDLSPRRAAFLGLWRETALVLAAHATGNYAQLRSRWRDASPLDPDDSALFLSELGYAGDALDVIETAVKTQQNTLFLGDTEWEALFMSGLAPLRRDPRVPGLLAEWGLFDYWRITNRWPDFCDEPTLPFNCKVEAQKFMRPTYIHAASKRS